MNRLRQLTHKSEVVAVARFLRISGLLKKCYYRCVAPPDGVLGVKRGGMDTKFYAPTPGDLRLLESFCCGEEKLLDMLISTLRPGDVAYDIGSNVGQFTIPLAKAVGEQGLVIAFEPEAQSYERLRNNVKLNGLSNVRIFQKALGEENCEAQLFVGGFQNRHSSLMRPDAIPDKGSQAVELVQGDEFRVCENLPFPRAVKIDVEGYEYSCLRGLQHTLTNPKCVLLCCEIHPGFLPQGVKLETVMGLVRSLGFSRIETWNRKTEIHVVAHKGASGYVAG